MSDTVSEMLDDRDEERKYTYVPIRNAQMERTTNAFPRQTERIMSATPVSKRFRLSIYGGWQKFPEPAVAGYVNPAMMMTRKVGVIQEATTMRKYSKDDDDEALSRIQLKRQADVAFPEENDNEDDSDDSSSSDSGSDYDSDSNYEEDEDSSLPTKPTNPNAQLSALPVEVRRKIFSHLIPRNLTIKISLKPASPPYGFQKSLLLLNKQHFAEAAEMIYGENHFSFNRMSDLQRFLNTIRQSSKAGMPLSMVPFLTDITLPRFARTIAGPVARMLMGIYTDLPTPAFPAPYLATPGARLRRLHFRTESPTDIEDVASYWNIGFDVVITAMVARADARVDVFRTVTVGPARDHREIPGMCEGRRCWQCRLVGVPESVGDMMRTLAAARQLLAMSQGK